MSTAFPGNRAEVTCHMCGNKSMVNLSPNNDDVRIIGRISSSVVKMRISWRCGSCCWRNEIEEQSDMDVRKTLGY